MVFNVEYPSTGRLYEIFRYPAGECQVRLTSEGLHLLKQADQVVVTARISNGEIMELCCLMDALWEHSATKNRIRLELPYLPYSRADRRFVDGDCLGLKVFGNLLAMMGCNVVTLDLHSQRAYKYFARLVEYYPYPQIQRTVEHIKQRLLGDTKMTILLPDEGAAKRYKHLYGLPLSLTKIVQCEKIREKDTGKLTGFKVPPIDTEYALIVDDICDGGGTFAGMAEKIYPKVKLYLYVSHGIFSKGLEPLKRFERIYTTDSFCRQEEWKISDRQLVVFPWRDGSLK